MEIPAVFYVFVIALSLILGTGYLYYIIKQNNEDFSRAERIILFALPISFVIGRASYVVSNFEEFRGSLGAIFMFWEGGINLPLMIISFFILTFCYCEVHALKAMIWCDMLIIPMVFIASAHELSLYLFFETFNEVAGQSLPNVTLAPIGFIEREFLQTPALFEGNLTFILAVILTNIKKYDSGAVFFLGVSLFFLIRFITSFFYVISIPFVLSFSHIFLLIMSVIFFALFMFTIKTQGGRNEKSF